MNCIIVYDEELPQEVVDRITREVGDFYKKMSDRE